MNRPAFCLSLLLASAVGLAPAAAGGMHQSPSLSKREPLKCAPGQVKRRTGGTHSAMTSCEAG